MFYKKNKRLCKKKNNLTRQKKLVEIVLIEKEEFERLAAKIALEHADALERLK